MLNTLQHIIPNKHPLRWLLLGFGGLSIGSILLALATDFYLLLALPMAFLVVYVAIVDFRVLFYLLLGCLPLSTELYFDNGMGTDFPSELLIIGLMGVYLLYAFRHSDRIDGRFFRHPISILLALHLGWIMVTAVTSSYLMISIKFVLAKIWYIVTFYLLAGHLLRTKADIKRVFICVFFPLIFTVIVTLIRHSAYGFSFEDVFRVLHPFYRNHVNYACLMALFFPFVWYAVFWYKDRPFARNALLLVIPFLLVAIYLSYTRAAYVALILAAGVYVVIRLRWMKYMLGAAVGLLFLGVAHLSHKNNYLDYAPDYERAITHKEFDDLLEATYKLEDISTMERVYRWVAASFMVVDKPVMGFGPGNFYHFYHGYTVSRFQTYVSDNPEKSSAHNYYLTIALEQGIPGLFIFLLLCFYALIRAENAYHRTKSRDDRTYLLAATLSFVIILSVLLINDLIETDKVGAFFFLMLAIIVNWDLKTKEVGIEGGGELRNVSKESF